MNVWRFRLTSTIDAPPPLSILDSLGYLADVHLDMMRRRIRNTDLRNALDEISGCRAVMTLADNHYSLFSFVLSDQKIHAEIADFNVSMAVSKIVCYKTQGICVSCEWIT